jgi:hypothetical protein
MDAEGMDGCRGDRLTLPEEKTFSDLKRAAQKEQRK